MTFYIEQDNKIVLFDEDKQKLQNTLAFMSQYEDLEIQETERQIITHNNTFVFKDTVLDELSLQIKNELIENFNYPCKEKVAYTGVMFDYNGQELCFETNKNSMSMINFTLTQILANTLTSVDNWKCRKTIAPYEPYSVTFTVQQFQQIVTFAGLMVTKAFEVEKQINEQIEFLTVEQLNNEEFVENFKLQIQEAYKQIPVKIENLFNDIEV